MKRYKRFARSPGGFLLLPSFTLFPEKPVHETKSLGDRGGRKELEGKKGERKEQTTAINSTRQQERMKRLPLRLGLVPPPAC